MITLGVIALIIAGICIPLGLIAVVIGLFSDSTFIRKAAFALLLTGGISLLASGLLCSTGAMMH